MVSVHLITDRDADEILRFELENRAFFEAALPGRGDAFFVRENMRDRVDEIVRDQANDLRYMYLIRDSAGNMVGRVNLAPVDRGPLQRAELGYRVGGRFNGMGYATEAVSLVMAEAFERLALHRVEASTAPDNIGSQIVLIKNGFQFAGRYRSFIHVNGHWTDSVLFERIGHL